MIRFALSALMILSGLFVLGVAAAGMFRFSTTLNRIHAAKCDTLGALLVLLGLVVMSGATVFSLKMLLVIIFMLISSPVAGHLIAQAEVRTNPKLADVCDLMEMDEDGNLMPAEGHGRD